MRPREQLDYYIWQLTSEIKLQYGITVPPEMFAFIEPLIMSAKGKYPPDNWLENDGHNADHKSNHASMSRHLAEHWCNNRRDKENGLDPLQMLACRAMMEYTRVQRGIKHTKDVKS